jgi:hypothetical protein
MAGVLTASLLPGEARWSDSGRFERKGMPPGDRGAVLAGMDSGFEAPIEDPDPAQTEEADFNAPLVGAGMLSALLVSFRERLAKRLVARRIPELSGIIEA